MMAVSQYSQPWEEICPLFTGPTLLRLPQLPNHQAPLLLPLLHLTSLHSMRKYVDLKLAISGGKPCDSLTENLLTLSTVPALILLRYMRGKPLILWPLLLNSHL